MPKNGKRITVGKEHMIVFNSDKKAKWRKYLPYWIIFISITWKSCLRDGHQVGRAKNRSAYPLVTTACYLHTLPVNERKFDCVGPGQAGFSKENFLSQLSE